MNTAHIRQLNVARVFHALRERPGSSQRQLGERTGLDKATVSAVVAQLESQGLLERAAKERGGRPGRPEVALRIAEGAGLLVGARLEPSTIRLIATTLAGSPKGSLQVEGSRDLLTALSRLERAVDKLIADCGANMDRVRGIGVGVPALMDARGNLTFAPNLGWRDMPIRKHLELMFRAPVYVDNDTKAAALAERLFGACREVGDFVFITGHSGVGGGLYLGGRLYRGAGGYAGEIGHMKIVPQGRPCGCGGRGCLEAYVSEAAIVRRLAEAGLHLADVWEIAEQAARGDAGVLEVLEATGEHLGYAIANLVNIANPRKVVLGGNLAVVAEYTLPALRRALAENALAPVAAEVELLVSPLGVEAVPMGGVALALEGFLSLPGWMAARANAN